MIDGFGFGEERTPSQLQKLIDSGELTYSLIRKKRKDKKTGKPVYIEYKKFADEEFGITIKVYPSGRYWVNGSFHKCKNKGVHNYDVFFFYEFISVLNRLEEKYGIDFSKVSIGSIEFGVNISLTFNPVLFIQSILWLGRGKFEGNSIGISIILSQYEIKIYSKSAQSSFRTNKEYIPKEKFILRIEVKIKKTQKLRKIVDIKNIRELANTEVWRILGDFLLKEVYDNLIVLESDKIESSNLTNEEKLELHRCQNPSHWNKYNMYSSTEKEDLIKEKNSKRKAKNRKRKAVIGLSDRISPMRIDVRKRVAKAIEETIQTKDLVENAQTAECDNLNISTKKEVSQIYQLPLKAFIEQRVLFNEEEDLITQNDLEDKFSFYYSDKWAICDITYTGRLCPVTKLPIDIMDFQQKYLLTKKGIKFYYYNYPPIFKEILFPLLRKRWYKESLDIWFEEIAHIIRSKLYNPQNNRKMKRKGDSNRNQLSFDF